MDSEICGVRIRFRLLGSAVLRLVECPDWLATQLARVGCPVPDSDDLAGALDLPCFDCIAVHHMGLSNLARVRASGYASLERMDIHRGFHGWPDHVHANSHCGLVEWWWRSTHRISPQRFLVVALYPRLCVDVCRIVELFFKIR